MRFLTVPPLCSPWSSCLFMLRLRWSQGSQLAVAFRI